MIQRHKVVAAFGSPSPVGPREQVYIDGQISLSPRIQPAKRGEEDLSRFIGRRPQQQQTWRRQRANGFRLI